MSLGVKGKENTTTHGIERAPTLSCGGGSSIVVQHIDTQKVVAVTSSVCGLRLNPDVILIVVGGMESLLETQYECMLTDSCPILVVGKMVQYHYVLE